MFKRTFLFLLMFVSFSFAQTATQQEKSEAREVTIKKAFGKVKMELFCGVVRPYEVKVPNPLIIMLENKKGYASKISYMKLNVSSGEKRLFIEAERGFANKDYSKLELRGLKKIENKGFSFPDQAHTVIVRFEKNKVSIDRVN